MARKEPATLSEKEYFGENEITILGNRKILQKDYNTFRDGLTAKYGSSNGYINEHISRALREYGEKLVKQYSKIPHAPMFEKQN
jgi:hypothetical protein